MRRIARRVVCLDARLHCAHLVVQLRRAERRDALRRKLHRETFGCGAHRMALFDIVQRHGTHLSAHARQFVTSPPRSRCANASRIGMRLTAVDMRCLPGIAALIAAQCVVGFPLVGKERTVDGRLQ